MDLTLRCFTSLWKRWVQCSSWTPPPFFWMSSWQIRHNLSSLLCKRRTKACSFTLNPTQPSTHLRTEPELVECRSVTKPTKTRLNCARLGCDFRSSVQTPLRLSVTALGLENSRHTHSNGAEGLIVHDNDGIHFNLVSVTFKQTNQIFYRQLNQLVTKLPFVLRSDIRWVSPPCGKLQCAVVFCQSHLEEKPKHLPSLIKTALKKDADWFSHTLTDKNTSGWSLVRWICDISELNSALLGFGILKRPGSPSC